MRAHEQLPRQRTWTSQNLEHARCAAHAALGAAARAANELSEALDREPELQWQVGPMVEKLLDAAATARLVEHELAATLAGRRQGGA